MGLQHFSTKGSNSLPPSSGTWLLGGIGGGAWPKSTVSLSRERKSIWSPWKLGKFIGHFEKASGLFRAQANTISGEQRCALSLSFFLAQFPRLAWYIYLSSPRPCGPTSCMAHGGTDSTQRLQVGAWMPQDSNGLQLKTHAKLARCCAGLSFNLEQDLWTLTLFLALLFHGGMDRNGTLASQEGNPLNFTSSKLYNEPPSSCVDLGKFFPHDTARTPLPPKHKHTSVE